jgi:hypothetical protein
VATEQIAADYLVVGAGAVAMSFVDTLLEESSARIAIVDRRHRAGGHWNDAYPFVRLHQPAAFYGVNSRELSQGTKDTLGLNKGLYDLAGGADVASYFDQVMLQRFLPSGRVQYFPMCDVVSDSNFESLLTGTCYSVSARKGIVDGTYADTHLPSTHPPKYAIAPGVRCIPLNDLPKVRQPQADFVVVGAGKTGMDACLWLLERGVDPDRIRWIMPRDAWLLDRANLQPGEEFFFSSIGSIVRQFEAVVAARNVEDLFDRLEDAGELVRIDKTVRPTIYRCATVSQAELAQLRRIKGIVRLGYVRAVEETRVVLDRGTLPLSPDALVVDCSACGIPQRPLKPIWADKRITLQMVRTCQPTFSAAIIAYVEAHFDEDQQKNGLCAPVPSPNLDTDWLRMLAVTMKNRYAWSQHKDIEQWLAKSRLDSFWASSRRVLPEDSERMAVLKRYRQSAPQVVAKLPQLLAAVA